ncbi:MAG: hypothetical protein V1676_04490 [Candidatus Diapherotrites archaeon]
MKGTKAKDKNQMYLLLLGVVIVAVIAVVLFSQPAPDAQAGDGQGNAATGDATDVLASGGGQPQEGTEPAFDSEGGEIAE